MSQPKILTPWMLGVEATVNALVSTVRANGYPKAFIQAVVGADGKLFDGVYVPIESCEVIKNPDGPDLLGIRISVSNTACKSAIIDEETGDLCLDVSFNGKPTIVAIKPMSVVGVFAEHNGTLFELPIDARPWMAYVSTMVTSEDQPMHQDVVVDPAPQKPTLKLVSDRDDVDFDESLPRPTTPFQPKIVH